MRIYQRCLSRRQCTFLLRVRKYRLHLVSKRNISISCISVVPTLFQDPPHQVPRARALSNMKRSDVQVRRRDDARHVQYEDGEQPCTPITSSYKCGQELYNTSRSQGVRYATMPSEQRSDKMLVDLRESSGFYILQTVLRSTKVSQSSYELRSYGNSTCQTQSGIPE